MLTETGIIGMRRSGKIEFNPQKYLREKIIVHQHDFYSEGKMRRTGAFAV